MPARCNLEIELFRESLQRLGEIPIFYKGASMVPSFQDGDQLWVRRVSKKNPVLVGSVVVYQIEDQLIAHRIVKKKRRAGSLWYYSRGDAGVKTEPPIRPDQIFGVVVARVTPHETKNLVSRKEKCKAYFKAKGLPLKNKIQSKIFRLRSK